MKTLYVVDGNGDAFALQISSWEVDSGCLLLYQENENLIESLHTALPRSGWEYASYVNPYDLERVDGRPRSPTTLVYDT